MTQLLKPNFQTDNPNKYVSWYLMASYMYYCRPNWESLMRDEDFDRVCKVLLDKYETLDHPHLHLIDKESLKAGTGFTLKEADYPLIVKHAALGMYDR